MQHRYGSATTILPVTILAKGHIEETLKPISPHYSRVGKNI
jgi:hypothetical protein